MGSAEKMTALPTMLCELKLALLTAKHCFLDKSFVLGSACETRDYFFP